MRNYEPCEVTVYMLQQEDVIRTSPVGVMADPFNDENWWVSATTEEASE